MYKKEMLIGSSGVITVLLTRKLIENIGIENIELQTRIIILFGFLTIYAIKSVREKDKNVRKYSILASIIFFIFGILLTTGMILKEGFPQYHTIVRKPLGILIFISFVSILIPAYGAYVHKNG
jgi:hypothetical protein